MTARDAGRALALGRVAVGAAYVIAPRLGGRIWVGRDGETPGATVLSRAFGIRDLIMGGLALHVLDQPGVGRRTFATFALADAVDFLATLSVRDRLPRATAGALALGATAAVSGVVISRGLTPPETPVGSAAR